MGLNTSIELLILIMGGLLLLSVIASKFSDKLGIPALLIFLIIGMLAGSEGIGGIYFDNPKIAQSVGFFALAVILFSGGLDTEMDHIRTVISKSLTLATLGVLLTALVLGITAVYFLKLTPLEGLLLGAIVSSTDAAAVFALLRSKGVRLQKKISTSLELESGSNDPMAVFLTVGVIQLIQDPGKPWYSILILFVLQMLIGLAFGWLSAKALLFLINRLRLGYEGLYPVLAMGMIFLTFSLTALLQGSGFLAVYIMGLVLAKADFLHKNSMVKFFNGLAWLSQIIMFLALGLFVFPSQLIPVIIPGLALAAILIFIARPLAVFLCLLPFQYSLREKTFIAWVGLRGAVPIVLATYPMLAGLTQSNLFFNIIFFIVILSVLVQGTTLPFFARKLKVEDNESPDPQFPISLQPVEGWKGILREINVNPRSPLIGKAIFEIGLPKNYIILLIARDDQFLIPNGRIQVQPHDRILGLAKPENHDRVAALFSPPGPE